VGLTSGQFSLLVFVSEDPVPTIGDLAEGLGMDRTTVLAALKPLEAAGLLTISPNPADRRGRLIALTGSGRQTLEDALPLWQAAQQDAQACLTDSDLQKLNGMLEALAR
jgi:DNA-binding MarR family transcriptional regulator